MYDVWIMALHLNLSINKYVLRSPAIYYSFIYIIVKRNIFL